MPRHDLLPHCTLTSQPPPPPTPPHAHNTQVIQLFETTIVRHGLMLVGPTMGGKTCCYRALQRALTSLNAQEPELFQKVGWSSEVEGRVMIMISFKVRFCFCLSCDGLCAPGER